MHRPELEAPNNISTSSNAIIVARGSLKAHDVLLLTVPFQFPVKAPSRKHDVVVQRFATALCNEDT